MVTLLLSSVFFLSVIAVGLYLWQRPRKTTHFDQLPPPPDKLRGLFESSTAYQLATPSNEEQLSAWLERAQSGDKNVLHEARSGTDRSSYDVLLSHFVTTASTPAELLSLCSYITRHELPVNRILSEAFIDACQNSLDRNSTAKMLHIAALSDDAEVYRRAVDVCLSTWRVGRLSDVSSTELQALINGEYWVLSSSTRSSGAGFVLKRTLSAVRSELEESINNQPSTASS
jgi:hypothetical protein